MKKKIYVCPRCGRGLNFSDNPEYTFQCFECDEDFYSFEAKEVEQPRMEGIVDYTDLAQASMKIKVITDKAIQASNKQIEIKSKDIVEQIAEYICETIQPILESGIYKEDKFRDCARIYKGELRLNFGDYLVNNKRYQAQFWSGYTDIYFNVDREYVIDRANGLRQVVENWSGFKDSMNRMIPYAIDECNKAHQRALEKQKEKEQLINSFKL